MGPRLGPSGNGTTWLATQVNILESALALFAKSARRDIVHLQQLRQQQLQLRTERPPQQVQPQVELCRHCLTTASTTAMLTTVHATLQTPISSLSKRQRLLVFLWAAILPRPSHKRRTTSSGT